MQTVLLVFHIFVSIALIGIVLIQRSSNDGLGLSGGGNNFMSGRASANLLTRATAILATIFMLNCLALAYLASHENGGGSIVGKVLEEQKSAPATTALPAEKKIQEEPAREDSEVPLAK